MQVAPIEREPRADTGAEAVTLGVSHPPHFRAVSPLWIPATMGSTGLQVPMKGPRRRILGSRPRPLAPAQANPVWSYDFVHDACANGQQLKCLVVVDEYTRDALAIDVVVSIYSVLLIAVQGKLVSARETLHYVRSGNGHDLVSTVLLSWIVEQGIETFWASRGKTKLTRASKAISGTNAWPWTGSGIVWKQWRQLRTGGGITTRWGRILAWAINRLKHLAGKYGLIY